MRLAQLPDMVTSRASGPPIVSVIITCYNLGEYLDEAVDSILSQTFGDFEFIIIDDGSTDTTAQILSHYAKQDERVRVFSHGNKGRAASLNDGIDLARIDLLGLFT